MKELVPVTAGETYEVSFTITSAVARSIFLKLGDVGNDGTVFKEDEIELEANTPYEYKAETDGEVSIENLMVLFALGQEGAGEEDNTITIENLALKGATSGYVDTTPYINFERVDGEDYIDAATNANVAYTGTTATVTGTDWAAGWGGGEEWGVQLKKLIPVTTGENYEVSFTATSEVARSIVVKLGDAANDETVFLNESIELEAGVPYTYTGTTTQEVDIEELLTVFALGLQGVDDQDNTITITIFR